MRVIIACVLSAVVAVGVFNYTLGKTLDKKDAEIKALEKSEQALYEANKKLRGEAARMSVDDEACEEAVALSREMSKCCNWPELKSFQERIEQILSIKSGHTWWERKTEKAEKEKKK